MKKLQHIAEYIILSLLLLIFRLLPVSWTIELGGFIGYLAYCLGVRVKISRRNVELAFGKDILSSRRDKIIRESYRNFGRSAAEFAIMPRLKGKLKELVRMENKAILDKFSGKSGAVLVSGHFSSWEIMGAALREYGYPVDFLVGKQKNPYVDGIMNKLRSAMGIGLISIGISVRGVIKALHRKAFIAMLSDQDAGQSGVIVDFFSQSASTPKGPAAFATQLNCPLIVGMIVREKPLTYVVYLREISLPTEMAKSEGIKELTQAYTKILEEFIMKYPEHYFWAHRRFKSTLKGFYK